VRTDGLRRLADPLLRGAGAPEADVVGDRAGEQEVLLRDHDDVPAQGHVVEVAQVDAVEGDAAVGGVVEA
jgi:hypothetical protein